MGIVEAASKEVEDEMEVEDSNDEEDHVLPSSLAVPKLGKQKKKGKENGEDEMWDNHKSDPLFKLEGNLRMKKAEKERRRNDKVGMALSRDMDAAFGSLTTGKSEDYSFDADFK